jgi:hypothetical protein
MTNVATLKKSARIRVLNDNFRSTFLGGQVAAPSFCAPADDAPADVCPARNRAQESLRPSGGIQSEKHSQCSWTWLIYGAPAQRARSTRVMIFLTVALHAGTARTACITDSHSRGRRCGNSSKCHRCTVPGIAAELARCT